MEEADVEERSLCPNSNLYLCVCICVFVYLDVRHLGTLFLRSSTICFSKIYHIMGLFRVFMVESSAVLISGWDGLDMEISVWAYCMSTALRC